MNNLPLVGRDADRQWLANSSGDIVVSGHPASGKTHLLRQFVDQGWLFMVDADRESIANAVRELQPDAIIVDDAHADLNSLGSLRQLRTEINAEFRIVAVTWPGDIDGVASTLAVFQDSVLDLQVLSRDQILEIVKAAGIAGPVELQRAIVNQSGGRPGLTATLCDVAWRGDLHPLLSGELLLREIRMALTRVGDFGWYAGLGGDGACWRLWGVVGRRGKRSQARYGGIAEIVGPPGTYRSASSCILSGQSHGLAA